MIRLNVKDIRTVTMQNVLVFAAVIGLLGLFVNGEKPAKTAAVANACISCSEAESQVVNSVTLAPPPDLDMSQLVEDAQAFYNSLSSAQQATLQKTYTTTLARKWSNLPCGSSCRNGIQLGTLSTAQLALAKQVIADVMGNTANNGLQEYNDITIAEDYLGTNGGSSQYNSGLRWLAFLNAPSETGAWMIQFGGHHYAANIAFNNGHVIGVTPFFVALEPTTFTYNGTSYAPMEDERTALRTMLASLSSTQLATAKLSTTFSDCLMSPGESNGNSNTFPTTKQGLAVSGLSSTQKDLVLAAIRNYVEDVDSTTAAAVMARYTAEIDQTYIAFTGSATAGNASTFLVSNSNYARIDGPTVWIEFACQNGIVIAGQIHYHSVWRDHAHDYGVDLSGDAIDQGSSGVSQFNIDSNISIYPNPSSNQINITLPDEVNDAEIIVADILGKLVIHKYVSGKNLVVDINTLPSGSYMVKIQHKNSIYTGKFVRS